MNSIEVVQLKSYVKAWYDGKLFGDGYIYPTPEGVFEFRLKCFKHLAEVGEGDPKFKSLLIAIPGGKA